jgi:hypothetical protein
MSTAGAAIGGAVTTALRVREGVARDDLAALLRRLAVADDFFADFLAVLTGFFLVTAVALPVRPADLVDVLLITPL